MTRPLPVRMAQLAPDRADVAPLCGQALLEREPAYAIERRLVSCGACLFALAEHLFEAEPDAARWPS
jgi:hypothetical protein